MAGLFGKLRRSGRPSVARQVAGRFRPRVQELENRVVPSTSPLGGMLVTPNLFIIPQHVMPDAAVPPSTMRHAYGVDAIKFGTVTGDGTGQTIVLVDAFNQPNIVSDLHAFDTHFGLPDPPSFKVLNQNLQTSPLPANSASWGLEESLDVEWSHVMAPGANIVLVEANSANSNDLFLVACKNAGTVGAQVSMSFGGTESSGETAFDQDFTTPGVSYFAASGDRGGVVSYPASSPNVIGVGGTVLATSGGKYVAEAGWRGSGGGPSTVEPEPAYQNGVQTSGKRETPDVAIDASPSSGVQIYYNGRLIGGIGGTSLASPMWAGVTAIANQGRALSAKGTLANMPGDLYSLPKTDFHDITRGGSSSFPCKVGYDESTGIGTPMATKVVPGLVGLANAIIGHPENGTGTGGSIKVPPLAETVAPVSAPVSANSAVSAPSSPAVAAANQQVRSAPEAQIDVAVGAIPDGRVEVTPVASAIVTTDTVDAPLTADLDVAACDTVFAEFGDA